MCATGQPLNRDGCLRSTMRNCSTSSRSRERRRFTTGRSMASAGSLIRIGPDREYLKRLLDAEAAFWQLVRDNVWPEPAGGELDLSADPKWRPVALRYREAKVRLEKAAAQEHKLRAMLESLATARRTFGSGVELLRSSRRGTVDYAAIPELGGVNLEPYRKPPVSVVRINFLEPGLA